MLVKIHNHFEQKLKNCEITETLSDCGYLVCSFDVDDAVHITDAIIPSSKEAINKFPFLLDQSFCVNTIEAMLPQGMFIGGIFLKHPSKLNLGLSQTDILNKISSIFSETYLFSTLKTVLYLFQWENKYQLYECKTTDFSFVEIHSIQKISPQTEKNSFDAICSCLGKTPVNFDINFAFSFLNPLNSKIPIEICFLQSLNKYFEQPELSFYLLIQNRKSLILRSQTSFSDSFDLNSNCRFGICNVYSNPSESNGSEKPSPPLFKINRISGEYIYINFALKSVILLPKKISTDSASFIYDQCMRALHRQINILMFKIREYQCHDIPHITHVFKFPGYAYPMSCFVVNRGNHRIVSSIKNLFGIKKFRNIISLVNSLTTTVNPIPENILISPHKTLVFLFDGEIVTTKGKYAYFHYGCQQIKDKGWGCAYRSFQTIFSWFVLNGFSSILSIPTINEIQQCLVDIGDKPSSIVNSSNWIGSIEIGMVLEKLLGLKYRIIQIYPGQSISEYIRHIMIHFKQNVSPIMIGGNNLAHTILGVAFDSNTGKCKFLVADPHYFGEDDLEIIISKGWVSWKNENFWKRDQSYNIILPCIEENQ